MSKPLNAMSKPLPRPTVETQPFWQAAAEGRLIFQSCTACGHAQFPPSSRCARCQNDTLQWRESARSGRLHTFTIVHRAPTAAFKADVPYVIALVDLDEGFRLMTNLRGAVADAVAIGDRVHIEFEQTEGPWPLPQARWLGR